MSVLTRRSCDGAACLLLMILICVVTFKGCHAGRLSCYVCDSSSDESYEEAEKLCNSRSPQLCPNTKNACMVEAFRHDVTFHVLKKCLAACPILVNSTADHIRCCATDGCNDVIDSTNAGVDRTEETRGRPIDLLQTSDRAQSDLDADLVVIPSTLAQQDRGSLDRTTPLFVGGSENDDSSSHIAPPPTAVKPTRPQPTGNGRSEQGRNLPAGQGRPRSEGRGVPASGGSGRRGFSSRNGGLASARINIHASVARLTTGLMLYFCYILNT